MQIHYLSATHRLKSSSASKVQKQGQLSLKPNDVKRREFLGHDRPMAFALGQKEIRKSAIETYSTSAVPSPLLARFYQVAPREKVNLRVKEDTIKQPVKSLGASVGADFFRCANDEVFCTGGGVLRP